MTIQTSPAVCGDPDPTVQARSCHPAGTARLESVPDVDQHSNPAAGPSQRGLTYRLGAALADLSEANGCVGSSPVVVLDDLASWAGDHLATSTDERFVRCLEELADPEVRPWLLPGHCDSGGPVQLTLL